jgi:hypothetical protein
MSVSNEEFSRRKTKPTSKTTTAFLAIPILFTAVHCRLSSTEKTLGIHGYAVGLVECSASFGSTILCLVIGCIISQTRSPFFHLSGCLLPPLPSNVLV